MRPFSLGAQKRVDTTASLRLRLLPSSSSSSWIILLFTPFLFRVEEGGGGTGGIDIGSGIGIGIGAYAYISSDRGYQFHYATEPIKTIGNKFITGRKYPVNLFLPPLELGTDLCHINLPNLGMDTDTDTDTDTEVNENTNKTNIPRWLRFIGDDDDDDDDEDYYVGGKGGSDEELVLLADGNGNGNSRVFDQEIKKENTSISTSSRTMPKSIPMTIQDEQPPQKRRVRGNDDRMKVDADTCEGSYMGILVSVGNCTIKEQARNVVRLNEFLAPWMEDDTDIGSSSVGNDNDKNKDSYKKKGNDDDWPKPKPWIEFLVVYRNENKEVGKLLSADDPQSNEYSFDHSKPDTSVNVNDGDDDGINLWIISMTYHGAAEMKQNMKEYAEERDSSPYLSERVFLNLSLTHGEEKVVTTIDESEEEKEKWCYLVNVDGRGLEGATAHILLIFIIMTILLPFGRTLLYCCTHYHQFRWRRNESGWVTGISWSRRNRTPRTRFLGDGTLPFFGGLYIPREHVNTLREEDVKVLPTLRYGIDDAMEVIEKYLRDHPSEDNDDREELAMVNCPYFDSTMARASGDVSMGDNESSEDTEDPASDKNIDASRSKSIVKAAFGSCVLCSICICDFEKGEEVRVLPHCGHIFHTECIMPWLTEKKGLCPLCQRAVGKTNILNDSNDYPIPQSSWPADTHENITINEPDSIHVNGGGLTSQNNLRTSSIDEGLSSSIEELPEEDIHTPLDVQSESHDDVSNADEEQGERQTGSRLSLTPHSSSEDDIGSSISIGTSSSHND